MERKEPLRRGGESAIIIEEEVSLVSVSPDVRGGRDESRRRWSVEEGECVGLVRGSVDASGGGVVGVGGSARAARGGGGGENGRLIRQLAVIAMHTTNLELNVGPEAQDNARRACSPHTRLSSCAIRLNLVQLRLAGC